MNCPHCGNRNPSGADRCLHCNALLTDNPGGGLFDLDPDSTNSIFNGEKLFYVVGAVFVAIIGGSMLLFGFDTVDSKCVRSESAAAKYESAPEWTRSQSDERHYVEVRASRDKSKTSRREIRRRIGFLRCYRKKTGHVDGVLE